jgi:predicted enzyme related to lactoylglutathione lyase
MTYFEVTDVDTTTTRVGDLGGHVLRPATDTTLGRMATVVDPEGAMFSVLSGLD